jgi:hypothetical protein
MGEWIYRSTFSDLGTNWRWVVSFTPRSVYPRGKSPPVPIGRRLGWPHRQSGRCGDEKILDLTVTRTPTAHSQSLYRLSYPGSHPATTIFLNTSKSIFRHDCLSASGPKLYDRLLSHSVICSKFFFETFWLHFSVHRFKGFFKHEHKYIVHISF